MAQLLGGLESALPADKVVDLVDALVGQLLERGDLTAMTGLLDELLSSGAVASATQVVHDLLGSGSPRDVIDVLTGSALGGDLDAVGSVLGGLLDSGRTGQALNLVRGVVSGLVAEGAVAEATTLLGGLLEHAGAVPAAIKTLDRLLRAGATDQVGAILTGLREAGHTTAVDRIEAALTKKGLPDLGAAAPEVAGSSADAPAQGAGASTGGAATDAQGAEEQIANAERNPVAAWLPSTGSTALDSALLGLGGLLLTGGAFVLWRSRRRPGM